ncbi:MAG: hypothetical protein JHC33_08860 [Ignisphaera sp.]|nr:hypothetical protein [Ignisphaera sp.]
MGGSLGAIGSIVGSYFGPVGSAVGGAIGSAIDNNNSSHDMQQQSVQTGRDSYNDARALGQEASNMAKFKPYGITSNLGSFNVSDNGNSSIQLSPQQQLYENQLNQQAMSFTGVNPKVDPQGLFNIMQAVRNPINQRDNLALEQRLASQGRLGLGSAMYGGGTPEQFALDQARQEQLSQDALTSMTQANQLTQQGLANQQSALGLSYIPQGQVQNLANFGYNVGNQYNQSIQNQANLFRGTAAVGLPALMNGYNNANDIAANQARTNAGLWNTVGQSIGGLLGGSSTAKMYGTNPWSEQTRMLSEEDF